MSATAVTTCLFRCSCSSLIKLVLFRMQDFKVGSMEMTYRKKEEVNWIWIERRNERCNEQPRTNWSTVDPLFDDKLTGRSGYHARHASVAGKIGSPCKMSSDRWASDIYACGKHYDPNCQYRYMCHVISQNGIYDA